MTAETRSALAGLAEERLNLVAKVPVTSSGLAWCRQHCDIADRAIKLIADDLLLGSPVKLAIVATGGYGRREMAPYSDIDLTVIAPDEPSQALDTLIRTLYQDIHWSFYTAMGLEVGWAYRLVSDAPALDERTQTGLLDGRLLAGSSDLWLSLMEAFWDGFSAGDFLLAKLSERQDMLRRHNETPLVVEPHLKEGAGGLRSFQCANWIRAAVGERALRPTASYDLILRFRNLLHFVAGKKQDHLTRGRQAEIADVLGVNVFDMAQDLTRAALELQSEYDAGLDKLREARYPLSKDVIAIRGEARVLPNSDAGEAAVGIGLATSLGLRTADLPVSIGPTLSGAAALQAIGTGEATLRNLDRCGLLEHLLPELTACRTLMPTDNVHVYTVFEHTLRVVRNLDAIEPETFLGGLVDSVGRISLLYLAALLHDVGKISADEGHEDVGAEMALNVCSRWDLAEPDAQRVFWLVKEHLTMARYIRIRDIQNPATITEFAAAVGEPERLHMLTLLTWADIVAVAPGALTTAQESFLRELHSRTMDVLQGEAPEMPDPVAYRRRLLRQLKASEVPEAQVSAFLESLPAHYLTNTDPEIVRLHMDFAQKAASGEPTIDVFHRLELASTELTVCVQDSPGLLSRMLGVIYALDLNVVGIRASTTSTDLPVAIDVFSINFGGKPVPPATSRQLVSAMLAVLKGEKRVEELLQERGKDPDRQQKNFRFTYIPGEPGILEVVAPRGRGMAYRFSRLIAEQGWNIVTARVSQWAGSGVAAFYILDGSGEPLPPEVVEQALTN